MEEDELNNKGIKGLPSLDKPWLQYYSDRAKNAPLPDCTIYQYLMNNNVDYPNDIAIQYFSNNVTYEKLFLNIDKCASSLVSIGVKAGDIVTIALPSIPEALYLVYALNKIGAVANMIHPLAGEQEILNYLNEVSCKIAFIFEGTYSIIKNSIDQTMVSKAIVISAGESLPIGIKQLYMMKNKHGKYINNKFITYKQFLSYGGSVVVKEYDKDPTSLAIISHTGGTTGDPKGVMCSDINANALMHQIVCNFEYERQGVSLAVLPPFVNYSLIEAMMAMFAIGYKVVLIPDYKPLEFVKYVNKYRPNIILSITAYWEAILKISDITKADMSCFEQIYAGGEAMSEENEQAVNEILYNCGSKIPLLKGLGSTEMTGGATQTYIDCNIEGSVGVPLINVNCAIVSPDDNSELEYNEEGEICFSGETVMMGYYNNKEATDDIIKTHSDGTRWLHTGDLGYVDEDGVVYVTGRIKRIIMTKGSDRQVTKIFPDRIEKAVMNESSVEICCAVGIKDDVRINYPKVFIVLREGYSESERLTERIMSCCKKELPEYMVPKEIRYVDSLPRTERGKVDYKAVERFVN